MPELPEAETIRLGLQDLVVGRRVVAVEATGRRSVRRHADPAELGHRLAGLTVAGVGRVGKFLTFDLAGGSDASPPRPGDRQSAAVRAPAEVMVVHLGMSGQLLLAGPGAGPRPAHSHVVLVFSDGGELRFVDPRTFGQVFVSAGPAHPADAAGPTRSAGPARPAGPARRRPLELAHLGFDPLEDAVRPGDFAAAVRARRTRLKPLLMDQTFVAGLGNIYSDEILHAAGLRYDRPADSVSEEEARRIHRQMLRILRASVRLRGSSLSDMQYRDVHGVPGRYQERHRVFAREGLPCATCGTAIVRRSFGGRSTFFCPVCQS